MSSVINFKRLNPQSLFVAACGLLIISMLIFGLFAWPSADDYCYANRFLSQGLWGTLHEEYFNWGGRYSATFLMGLVETSRTMMHAPGYAVVPLINILSIVFGVWVFLRGAFGINNRRLLVVASAALLALISWRQSIYWLSGGFTYAPPVGLMLIVLAAAFRSQVPSQAVIWGTAVLIFITCGFNEGTAILQGSVLGLLLLTRWKDAAWAHRATYLVWCAAAAAGTAAAFLAPGVFVRAELMTNATKPIELLNGFIMPFSSLLLGLVLLVFWSAVWLLWRNVQVPRWLPQSPWKILLGIYLVWVPVLAMRGYMLSGYGDPRVLTPDMLVVWTGAMLLALVLVRRYYGSLPDTAAVRSGLALVALVALLMVKGANPDGLGERWLTLVHQAPKVHRAMSAREDQYAAHNGQIVEVSQLRPKVLQSPTFMADVEVDPAQWGNQCLAKYYGIPGVTLRPVQ